MMSDAAALAEGHILAGRYRVLRQLGAGGMSQVYLAEDIEMDRMLLAIKVLRPGLSGTSPTGLDLKREAAVGMKLSHSNICRVFGYHGATDETFMVMEYIRGKTLDQILQSRPNRAIPLTKLVPLAAQVAAALDWAHGLEPPIVHGDIKPANVMVTPEGTVKVLDFGAAEEQRDPNMPAVRRKDAGTPGYLSPERVAGGPRTVAADVFAFAAMLYRCLSGHPPPAPSACRNGKPGRLPGDLPELPDFVISALRYALATEPALRPAGVGELMRMVQGEAVFGPGNAAEPSQAWRLHEAEQLAKLPVARPADRRKTARRANGALVMGVLALATSLAVLPSFVFGALAVAWGVEARRSTGGDAATPRTASRAIVGIVCGAAGMAAGFLVGFVVLLRLLP